MQIGFAALRSAQLGSIRLPAEQGSVFRPRDFGSAVEGGSIYLVTPVRDRKKQSVFIRDILQTLHR